MKYKGKGIKTDIICYMLIISIIAGLFVCFIPTDTYGYENQKGIVQADVLNVRTGPGTTYNKLVVDGTNVKLVNGDALTIIGEEYASDGSKWFQVTFAYKDGEQTGYVHSNYVYVENSVEYTPDMDFEQYLTDQGFPESYKESLRTLHAQYPNWVFVADILDYDWSEVVTNESLTGRSLISKNSISSWKSTATDAFNWNDSTWYGFDGGSWNAASVELVSYALDARNFLNEKYIFQFESLSYQPSYQTIEGVEKMIEGTFMEDKTIKNTAGEDVTYAQAIMDAAAVSGVSPFHLVASIIQEQGSAGTSGSISGKVNNHEGYYNFYNWGAYAGDGNSAIVNGLIYAAKTDEYSLRPWDSQYKSILGGAKLLGKNYINIGQDTLYYKKFDFVGTPYTHQYMTHIIAARNEGMTTAKGYSDEMKSNINMVFKIPVFQNMPETICTLSMKDGSPNNALKSLSVSSGVLTPTFSIFQQSYDVTVENAVTSIEITAETLDATAKISGTQTYNLNVGNNKIEVLVTAENGDIRIYTIYVNRKAGQQETTTKPTETTTQKPTQAQTTTQKPTQAQTTTQKPTETSTQAQTTTQQKKTTYSVSTFKADETTMILSGMSAGTTSETLQASIKVTNGTLQITDAAGNKKGTSAMATGDIVKILDSNGVVFKQFQVVLYGDVNGDGKIDVKDAFLMRKHILGVTKLTGIYATAADTSRTGDGITVKDAFLMRKHILGQATITQ